jgi:hypothetical protein
MKHLILATTLAVLLAACSNAVQTSSGAQYLKRYADAPQSGNPLSTTLSAADDLKGPLVTDDAIRRAAAIEPDLKLPGRFGLARLINGQLTIIPQEEAALWFEYAKKHQSLGEFVPINPLIAAFAESAVISQKKRSWQNGHTVGDVVSTIRLGAARQHVDTVLIYEIGTSSSYGKTPFAITDLTIIGAALLPNRTAKAHGIAHAILLDVRNGYPYGSATAEIDVSGFSTTFGSGKRQIELREEAAESVVAKLIPEVEAMFIKLVEATFAQRQSPTK